MGGLTRDKNTHMRCNVVQGTYWVSQTQQSSSFTNLASPLLFNHDLCDIDVLLDYKCQDFNPGKNNMLKDTTDSFLVQFMPLFFGVPRPQKVYFLGIGNKHTNLPSTKQTQRNIQTFP